MSDFDEPNPFADDSSANAGAYVPPSAAAIGTTAKAEASSATVGSGSSAMQDTLSALQIELNSRETECERQEVLLQRQGFGQPNWPFSCLPWVRHSIKEDIPARYWWSVRQYYLLWIFLVMCLLMNAMTWFALWLSPNTPCSSDTSCDMFSFFALIALILGAPGAWILWYKPVYELFKNDPYRAKQKSWTFFTFNFNVVHWVYAVYVALGIPQTAAAGWVTTFVIIDNADSNWGKDSETAPAMKGMWIFNSILWTIVVLWSTYMSIKMYKFKQFVTYKAHEKKARADNKNVHIDPMAA